MIQPFLVAQTPRAGVLGHRFLVPPGLEDSETVTTQLITAATRALHGRGTVTDDDAHDNNLSHAEGLDFIAVGRRVEQRLPNGSVREGDEMLVLGGVSVEQLDQNTRSRVANALRRRVFDLEALVASVDWERESRGAFLARSELTAWLHEEGLACIRSGGQPPSRSLWSLTAVVGAAAAVALVCAFIFYPFPWVLLQAPPENRTDSRPEVSPLNTSPATASSKRSPAEVIIEKLANEFGHDKQQIADDLGQILFENPPPQSALEVNLSSNDAVRHFLAGDPRRKNNPFAFLQSIAEDEFPSQLRDWNSERITELRISLVRSRSALKACGDRLARSLDGTPTLFQSRKQAPPDERACLELMAALAKDEVRSQRVGPPPVVPYLGIQDLKAVGALKANLDANRWGEALALPKERRLTWNGKLPWSALEDLRKNEPKYRGQIENVAKNSNHPITKKVTDPVADAYATLLQLVSDLATIELLGMTE